MYRSEMKLHLRSGSSGNQSASWSWLNLALITLLSLASSVSAQQVSGRMRELAAHGAPKAATADLLYIVDSSGDGPLVGSTSFCDDGTGKCTLRAAIEAANGHAGNDGIQISIPASDPNCDVNGRCVIYLASALPSLSTTMDITGPGADKLTIQRNAGPLFRIFDVTSAGTVTLSGMTISGGNASGTGGGVQNNNGGTLNIINCLLWTNFSGGNGGAVYNSGTGTVNITGSELYYNFSTASGGGIFNNGTGTINVTNSTITENSAATGGAIFNNSTGTVNASATARSRATPRRPALAEFSTTAPGSSMSRARSSPPTLATHRHPMFPAPSAHRDSTSSGRKMGSTEATQPTDQSGTVAAPLDPKLAENQAANGGHTQSIRLLCSSPAIDKGTSAGLTGNLTTDQRGAGFPRIFDDAGVVNASGGDGRHRRLRETTNLQPTARIHGQHDGGC